MSDTKDTRREVVASALSVAEAVAEGHMSTADLEQAAVDQCRELFGTVYGPGDELWPLHVDVVRQVLAFGGMPADELAEWTAVQRRREGIPVVEAQVSWIEQALAQGDDEDDDAALFDAGVDIAASDAVRDAMTEVEARVHGEE